MNSSSAPKLFALIIGINVYNENIKPLRGAVPDALAFKQYIEEYLKVPPNQVVTLLDEEASRYAIIEALISLKHDGRINRGDAIVIYYAGHGYESPSLSGSVHKSRHLIPQDSCCDAGQGIGTVSDSDIANLLYQLSGSKGDNITLILDCCNAAWETHISSHTLIAACRSFETALEENCRGNFTTALLKLLKTTSPDELKHCDIIARLEKIPGQHPQCEGLHPHRYLFDSKVSIPKRKDSEVSLDHGGLTEVSERQGLPIDLPSDKVLPLCDDALLQEMQEPSKFENIPLFQALENSHIELVIENGKTPILIKDGKVQHGLDQLYSGINPAIKELALMIETHNRKPNRTDNEINLTNNIQTETYKSQERTRKLDQETIPVCSNFREDTDIDDVVDEEASVYGIELTVNLPCDLIPNINYSNENNVSISFSYKPATALNHTLDVPGLQKNGGILFVRFGDEGMPPLVYFRRGGQNLAIGSLKLFASTKDVNHSNIPQLSPSAESRTLKRLERRPRVDTGGTILVIVLKRRQQH